MRLEARRMAEWGWTSERLRLGRITHRVYLHGSSCGTCQRIGVWSDQRAGRQVDEWRSFVMAGAGLGRRGDVLISSGRECKAEKQTCGYENTRQKLMEEAHTAGVESREG